MNYRRILQVKSRAFAITCAMGVIILAAAIAQLESGAVAGPPIATLTVTKTADTNDGVCNSDCSLREAIAAASPGDVINFAAGVTGTITLAHGQLNIYKGVTINGPGSNVLTISGNYASQVIRIQCLCNVTFIGLTIAKGYGGGIVTSGSPTQVNIINSTISDNSASSGGGGIFGLGTTLKISNSTISGNSAGGDGGGMCCPGCLIDVLNSTITDNAANSGGGICYGGGIINILNSTISGNWALNNGGGLVGPISIKNSIVAQNSAIYGVGDDVYTPHPDYPFKSQGYNLIGNGLGSKGFQNGLNHDIVGSASSPIDPRLGPFQYNGGTTKTMALLPDSPAIDAGAAAINPISQQPITDDQRGYPRPREFTLIPNPWGGNGSDIGAFEVQPPTTAKLGCGCEFWKARMNHSNWVNYEPELPVPAVFSGARAYPSLASLTLLQALDPSDRGGPEGGARILLRQAVAALLNASHPEVTPRGAGGRDVNGNLLPQDAQGVIADTNTALQTNDREVMIRLAVAFEASNNQRCPLE